MKIMPDYVNGWKLVPDEGEASLDTTTDIKTVLSKYHPPIEVYMGDMDVVSFTKKINEELDNEICYEIRQKFCVDGSNEELMKALNYDRNQYEAGYRDGLNDGLEKAAASPWKPYPEENPGSRGTYLVIIEYDDGTRYCDCADYNMNWLNGYWSFNKALYDFSANVIYWAEVKFPKRKENKNESE